MKILYLECHMGAAGDMLTAALYELLSPAQRETFLNTLRSVFGPELEFSPELRETHGISGTKMHVKISGHEEGDPPDHPQGHHHGRSFREITAMLNALSLPPEVLTRAKAVYRKIARAEGRVHGTTPELVHFHEVGALDAIADVTGACLALSLLAPDRVVASPVSTGFGQVRCAHGLLPVPAPATALLLEGAEITAGPIEEELCTPTGAALLTEFAEDFGTLPSMKLLGLGVGVGTKDFGVPNCLRAFWGETQDTPGELSELVCNLDDMSPEALAFACERLRSAGALDLYLTPGVMKKGRAGQELTLLCTPAREEDFARLILRETSTQGLRIRRCRRVMLTPGKAQAETPWGPAGVKTASGFGITHKKPEYEDAARIARDRGLPISEVLRVIEGVISAED